MILAEQGKLSIEDKLTRYINDYPNGDKITIHHLLSHTSGITNFTALPVYDSIRTKPHTLDQLIAYFKNKPLDFEPGTKFNYSNSGYLLLSYIIEKVSGQTIAGYILSQQPPRANGWQKAHLPEAAYGDDGRKTHTKAILPLLM